MIKLNTEKSVSVIFYGTGNQERMALTFQELILNLSKFWSDYGCIIQQPYDIEKGAF